MKNTHQMAIGLVQNHSTIQHLLVNKANELRVKENVLNQQFFVSFGVICVVDCSLLDRPVYLLLWLFSSASSFAACLFFFPFFHLLSGPVYLFCSPFFRKQMQKKEEVDRKNANGYAYNSERLIV